LQETLSLCEYLKESEVSSKKSSVNPKENVSDRKIIDAGDSYLVNKTDFLTVTTKEDIVSSLNRLHTFNMKESGANNDTNPNINQTEEISSVCPSKTFYFEENVMVLDKLISLYQPILSEISRKITPHEDRLSKTKDMRTQNISSPSASLVSAFTRGKIDEMKRSKLFKIKPRSLLGLKSKEDWIFNINIGNVMHLSALSLEDLAISPQIAHEMCRDALYEKIIMLSIAYFSLATECRFIYSEDNTAEFYQQESKYWHKAAVEFVCTFLPSECPLVGHIITSYEKHNSLAQEVIVFYIHFVLFQID